jgi:hypothetical protein
MSEFLGVYVVLKIILLLYQFPIHFNFSETSFTYWMYTAQRVFLFIWMIATLGLINQISEAMGITVELKGTSQATNHMQWMLRCQPMWAGLL